MTAAQSNVPPRSSSLLRREHSTVRREDAKVKDRKGGNSKNSPEPGSASQNLPMGAPAPAASLERRTTQTVRSPTLFGDRRQDKVEEEEEDSSEESEEESSSEQSSEEEETGFTWKEIPDFEEEDSSSDIDLKQAAESEAESEAEEGPISGQRLPPRRLWETDGERKAWERAYEEQKKKFQQQNKRPIDDEVIPRRRSSLLSPQSIFGAAVLLLAVFLAADYPSFHRVKSIFHGDFGHDNELASVLLHPEVDKAESLLDLCNQRVKVMVLRRGEEELRTQATEACNAAVQYATNDTEPFALARRGDYYALQEDLQAAKEDYSRSLSSLDASSSSSPLIRSTITGKLLRLTWFELYLNLQYADLQKSVEDLELRRDRGGEVDVSEPLLEEGRSWLRLVEAARSRKDYSEELKALFRDYRKGAMQAANDLRLFQ